MKTFKRNKKQTRNLKKMSRRSSYKNRNKTRARGWFRKTPEHTNLENWIKLKADKLNEILIKIFNKMDHNKTCSNPVTRKKYVFTKCEKSIEHNKVEAEQIIQALNANIQLNINTPNFNTYKYLKLFEDRAKMFNTDISEFNTFQKNLFNRIINFKKYEAIKTIRKSSSLKTAIEETGFNLESKSRLKLQSLFLQSICSDTGYCMTFGQEDTKIKKFFKGFTNFEYAIDPILLKGKISTNGFVNQITYEREGYKAYTILKSSKTARTDNLMYEYRVGQYINTWTKRLPCFVETYGLFKYANDIAGGNFYAAMQTAPASFPDTDKNINELKKSLHSFPNIDWKVGCLESQKFAILIQHFDNIETLKEWIINNTIGGIFTKENELIHILFQIYIPLGLLYDKFTHYDLHENNVLIYTPSSGKMIKYKYHIPQTYVNKLGLSSNLIEFDSPYIVKIIDYGRCYFNMNVSNNALSVYNEICAEPECNSLPLTTCGNNFGFGWNGPVDLTRDINLSTKDKQYINHLNITNPIKYNKVMTKLELNRNQIRYISAQTNNSKYDLAIANNYSNIIGPLLNIKILFEWGKSIDPSIITNVLIVNPLIKIVTTVYDLLDSICDYSKTVAPIILDDTFIGILDIFVDEDMVFKPTKEFKETERVRRSQFKTDYLTSQKIKSEANKKLKKETFKEDLIKSKRAYKQKIEEQLKQQLAPINERLSEENQILSEERRRLSDERVQKAQAEYNELFNKNKILFEKDKTDKQHKNAEKISKFTSKMAIIPYIHKETQPKQKLSRIESVEAVASAQSPPKNTIKLLTKSKTHEESTGEFEEISF